jgi:hypothetical protein
MIDPFCSTVIGICSPVGSPDKFYQFVGRGLRVVRDGNVVENPDIVCDLVFHTEAYPSLPKMYQLMIHESLIENMEEKLQSRYSEKGGEVN